MSATLPKKWAGSLSWRRVSRNVNDYGWGTAIRKILNSAAHNIYYNRAYVLYRGDLSRSRLPEPSQPGFEFRFIAPSEKDFLRQIGAMEEWLEGELERMLKEGGKCLVALDGDQIAGFNVVSFEKIALPVIAFSRRLRKGEAYSEQITVKSSYRGRNLGSLLRIEMFRSLQALGMRKIYGGTDIGNRSNLALCAKVGLKPFAVIRHIQIFGFKTSTIQRRHL
jgi:GNAT superfamily N-acetyltransferase